MDGVSRFLSVLAVLALSCAGPFQHARAEQVDTAKAPYEFAEGAADARTGALLGVSAHGFLQSAALSGSVGIVRATGPGEVGALAIVEVLDASLLGATASICVELRGAGLPNHRFGGGPVCSPGSEIGGGYLYMRVHGEAPAQTALEVRVTATRFARYGAIGATAGVARVESISFAPA